MPGILYQTEGEGKRAKQQRETVKESALEAEHCREREIASAIK